MALSGSFSTSVTTAGGQLDANYPRNLVVTWTATQNVTNNTSTISWTLKTGSSNSAYYYTSVNRIKLTINGTVVYNDQSTGTYRYANETLGSGSITVSHNSDGTKSVAVYAEAGFYEWVPNSSYSGTISLNTIPRASSMSFGEFTMGTDSTISISRASNSFTHTLRYVFGTKSGTIASQTSNTSVSWAPPLSELASQIPSSTRGVGTLYIDTYSGSTLIGTKSYTFYCNIPSNVKPTVGTVTVTPTAINGHNILVKDKNKLTVSTSGCSAGIGSSIKSYTFSGPSMSTTTTNTSAYVNSVSSSGTLTYTVTVTDLRGRTASKTCQIVCYNYYTPSFTVFDAYRANASGTADNSGTYLKCTYSISYATVNNTNIPTVNITYTTGGITKTTAASGGSTLINLGENAATYRVYAKVTDSYSGSASSSTINVFGATRIFNVTKDGTGFAIGKIAESSNLFESRWPIKADDVITTLKPIETLQGLSYRGQDVISSTNDDTTANWNNQGNLATVFYTQAGQVNGQPSQYGFLLNATTGPGGQEAHQLWMEQNDGSLYHRGGNAGGMATNWKQVLDSSNYTNYIPYTDYIVEQGISGNITYRKWNSGVSEAWYYEQLDDVPLTTAMTENVYSDSSYNRRGVNMPSGLFLTGTIPIATANAYSNGYTSCQVASATSTQVIYRLWSPYSATITGCRISIQIVGRWK